jgi:hypothetical protein
MTGEVEAEEGHRRRWLAQVLEARYRVLSHQLPQAQAYRRSHPLLWTSRRMWKQQAEIRAWSRRCEMLIDQQTFVVQRRLRMRVSTEEMRLEVNASSPREHAASRDNMHLTVSACLRIDMVSAATMARMRLHRVS